MSIYIKDILLATNGKAKTAVIVVLEGATAEKWAKFAEKFSLAQS